MEPIDRAECDASLRKLCRQIGSAIIAAMSATDTNFKEIDTAVQWTKGTARRRLLRLCEGKPIHLDHIAVFALAMNAEWEFRLMRRPAIPPVEPASDAPPGDYP